MERDGGRTGGGGTGAMVHIPRVAAKQHFPNFGKHKILTKLFKILQNFAKFSKNKIIDFRKKISRNFQTNFAKFSRNCRKNLELFLQNLANLVF